MMNIAEEIRKLQELHVSGALTDAEFAQAKARVLAGETEAAQADALRDQLSELQREQALDRLDRAWDRERESYMVTSRYGHRYRPSKVNSIIMAAGIVGFGLIWGFTAVTFGGGLHGGLFPLLGAVFVAFGLGMASFSFVRANQYDQAYRRYQRQRALLLSGADEGDNDVLNEAAAPLARQRTSTAIQGETAPCWKCGRAIRAGQTECPHCGWMSE
jgi:hypothetical protein